MGIYSNVIKDNKYDILNEVYFGQTEGITKLFNAFCKFRDKYVTDRRFFLGDIDADHDPSLKDFISEVEREFNIYSFSIIIENNDMPNMMTIMPFSGKSNNMKSVKASNTGYKFAPGNEVAMIVIAPTGLLFNSDFTDREMFAILLHEIGHNFQDLINGGMNTLSTANKLITIYYLIMQALFNQLRFIQQLPSLVLANNEILKKLSKIFNSISISDQRTIYSYYNFLSGIAKNIKTGVTQLMYFAIYPILGILGGLSSFLDNISMPTFAIHGYRGELMADKFPTFYGFGPDSYTADSKLEGAEFSTNIGSVIQKIPLLSHFRNILALPANLIMELTDCHPGTASRMKGYVDQLEYDLNDPRIDSKAKKLIKKDLDEIRESEKKIFELNTKINNPYVVKWWYNNFIYHCCGGDLKYSINKKLFNDSELTNKQFFNSMNNESSITNLDIK